MFVLNTSSTVYTFKMETYVSFKGKKYNYIPNPILCLYNRLNFILKKYS